MFRDVFYIALIISVCVSTIAIGQVDTYYIASYTDQLTGRFYFSQKYTAFKYYDEANDLQLRYLPNTTFNMGVGATYKVATLNLAYGFGFLNPDIGQGKTKYLDLQAYFYADNWLIDLLGQFYNGFFLSQKDANGDYYVRPDIKVREFGATFQYMLNKGKFSYRAGFLQNEWQKKSAGTPLIGWQVLFGNGSADSTLIPYTVNSAPIDDEGRHLSFFETGPNVGYAYTLVIKKHFFIMGSASATLSFGTSKVEAVDVSKYSSLQPNFELRACAGYNSEKTAISLTLVDNTVSLASNKGTPQFSLSTGNLRLNFVRRFSGKKLKSLINKRVPEKAKVLIEGR